MSCSVALEELSQIIDANFVDCLELVGGKVATGITTDTRTLQPQEVFVAIAGENSRLFRGIVRRLAPDTEKAYLKILDDLAKQKP